MKKIALFNCFILMAVKKLATQWDKIAARADALHLGAWHGKATEKKAATE